MTAEPHPRQSVEDEIIAAVAEACGVDAESIRFGISQSIATPAARQLAAALIRNITIPTPALQVIAQYFGWGAHTTAAYAVRQGERHPLYPAMVERFTKEEI